MHKAVVVFAAVEVAMASLGAAIALPATSRSPEADKMREAWAAAPVWPCEAAHFHFERLPSILDAIAHHHLRARPGMHMPKECR